MSKELQRTERGFIKLGEQKTKWHGNVRVQESSVAFNGPCFWVFTELAYSNTPRENPPTLHLTLEDARFLRDNLSECIKVAEKNLTCERIIKEE